MNPLLLTILKKIDPKWLPAILGAVTILGSITYLIYSKRRAELLNSKLKTKLALAEADALNPLIEESKSKAHAQELKANTLSVEILELKKELGDIKNKSKSRRDKILIATSWKDLDL
jgi:hypothetical protein